MAQHGYLHDTYDRLDFDGDDDRERSWRDDDRQSRWRSRHREDERGWSGRDRSMMFGDDRNRDYDRGSDANEWFGGRGQQTGRSGSQGGQRFSSHPDDHYRSWRDRHMQALDREYEEYCRERERQFNLEFDSWRQNRQHPNLGLREPFGVEQGNGPDEQTFTPQTTAVSNTMTTSETHEPQTTTDPDRVATIETPDRRRR